MFEGLEKLLILKHPPTVTEPWGEIEYTESGDIHKLIEFSNKLSNLSYLSSARVPYFFRGQADSDWHLEPVLYRLLKGIPLEEALRLEFDAIQYFKQHARAFLQPQMIPKDDDIGQWIALMQHHRAPTRMLDWTASCNVALYFAVFDEPQDKPGALWFFLHENFWKAMKKFTYTTKEQWHTLFSDREKFVEFGCKKAQPRVDGYEPDIKSERMAAQQSIFTFCEQLFCDQAQVIGKALAQDAEALPLSKIVVGPNIKKQMREHLNKLNINAVTLFPGVEGLGRSVKEIITVYREVFHT